MYNVMFQLEESEIMFETLGTIDAGERAIF